MFQAPRYACALSRAHPSLESLSEDSRNEEMELRIHGLVSSLPISGEKMHLLKQSTAADETLQMILHMGGQCTKVRRHKYKAILAYPR